MRDAHYLIPRRDGLILAGSTVEFVGFDKSVTTDDAFRPLHAAALSSRRGLPTSVEHHWAGLRPAPAGIRTSASTPASAACRVNAGHYRNGLVTGGQRAAARQPDPQRNPILDPAPYGFGAGRLASRPASPAPARLPAGADRSCATAPMLMFIRHRRTPLQWPPPCQCGPSRPRRRRSPRSSPPPCTAAVLARILASPRVVLARQTLAATLRPDDYAAGDLGAYTALIVSAAASRSSSSASW